MKTSIHYKKNKLILVFKLMPVLFMFLTNELFAQLVINTTMTPTQLVQNVLVGTGVTISNVTYSGINSSIGSFSGGGGTNLGLESGVIMSTGDVSEAPGPVTFFASNTNGTFSDPQLAALISYAINDAAVLEFDFIPESDTIKFRYVFGSEEYPEYVSSSFNDVFGFFVTGPNPSGGNYSNKNIALIPGTTLPVTIDNINNVTPSYPQYYIDNEGIGGTTIVYDGFTTVLTAWCLVTPCVQYHIKIAIGDAGDSSYDSAVFLEENSFTSNSVTVSTAYSLAAVDTTAIEGCSDAIVSFVLSDPLTYPLTVNYTISGTATNGVDYTNISNSVVIPAGQDSVSIIISPFLDGITEGTETVVLIIQTSPCATDTITIQIIDNITLSLATSNDTMICGGQANVWASASEGMPPYTYIWSNGASTSNFIASPVVTTTYIVTANDICSAQLVDSVIVSVGSDAANAGPDAEICIGGTTTLTASGGNTYNWSNGINTATNMVSPLVTTTYYVTVTSQCPGYDTVVVFVNPLPTVYTGDDTTVCYGDEATLTVNSNGIYLWSAIPPDPSLNGQETLKNPVVHPEATTTYTATVTDTNNCSNADMSVITVKDCSTFYVPNAFTPNADGINDEFKVYGEGVSSIEFKIFSRWGQMVFETKDINEGWNGKINGKLAPAGVYVYKISYHTAKKFYKVYGHVVLL